MPAVLVCKPSAFGRGFLCFCGGGRLVELPQPAPDGRIYVNTTQAAEAMGVTKTTIGRWRSHSYLEPLPGSPRRKPLYAWDDVVEAEHRAWQAGLSTSGVDPRLFRDLV